jgi:hypothetical protein
MEAALQANAALEATLAKERQEATTLARKSSLAEQL